MNYINWRCSAIQNGSIMLWKSQCFRHDSFNKLVKLAAPLLERLSRL